MLASSCRSRVAVFAAAAVATVGAHAQCPLQWLPTAGTDGPVCAFATMPNGDLVAGGVFTTIAGTPAARIARRSGGTWSPLGAGANDAVFALAVMPNGDLIAGGQFTVAGGVPAAGIARWDGAAWSPLGSGVSGAGYWGITHVRALAVLPDGDLVAGGHFLAAGGVPANNVARWDGASWASLGGGVSGPQPQFVPPNVRALAVLGNGDVVAAGHFQVAGSTAVVGAPIARWDGRAWSLMNAGWPPFFSTNEHATCLVTRPDGELVGGGAGATAVLSPPMQAHVARWTGSAWEVLPGLQATPLASDGSVAAIAIAPDGELLVGGRHTTANGAGVNQLLRWTGASWSAITGAVPGSVFALAMTADGALAVGGSFATAGSPPSSSPFLAHVVTPCLPHVTVSGAGCASSIGPHTLTALSPPWLGGTFRARAGGMPASSLGIAVTSLSPATIALAQVLPVGGAGCDGLLFADLTELLLPAGGDATSSLPLPDLPVFAGLALHHYVAALELGAGGGLVALTATPRLVLQLGAF